MEGIWRDKTEIQGIIREITGLCRTATFRAISPSKIVFTFASSKVENDILTSGLFHVYHTAAHSWVRGDWRRKPHPALVREHRSSFVSLKGRAKGRDVKKKVQVWQKETICETIGASEWTRDAHRVDTGSLPPTALARVASRMKRSRRKGGAANGKLTQACSK